MRITPLAADSMGVRSMATLVETDDIGLLIDPGVALGKVRDGLRPHPNELKEKERRWARVMALAERCDILVVTHYHYDHHNPSAPEVYRGKVVFIKDPVREINYSQKLRAGYFLKQIKPCAKRIEIADTKQFKIGGTEVRFSHPVPHGVDTRLGYVIMVSIREKGEVFLHTSDVEGPSLPLQERTIIEFNPDIVLCDGPMTHMLGNQYPESALISSENNLITIVSRCELNTLILDHHFLRDINWRSRIPTLISRSKDLGTKLMTAAEFAGEEDNLLEANRADLYRRFPVENSEKT